MQEYIYIINLTEPYRDAKKWTEETNNTIGAHFNYLKELYEKNIIRFVGKTELDIEDIDNTGIAIFSADSLEEAKDLMSSDPAVKCGIMKMRVLPFKSILPFKQ